MMWACKGMCIRTYDERSAMFSLGNGAQWVTLYSGCGRLDTSKHKY